MDNNLDLFANKLANALKEKGYSTSINYSNTDFGQSTYIYVRKSENEIDYNDYLKIRISDHSVENLNRMRDEYHILFNYTLNEELAIEDAINSVNYYFYRDKYFDKQDIVVQQKAYNVQTDSPSETDVITKQWVTKKTGKTIYEVTRTYNIPATKWINKETGNVFRTIIKNNFEYGGKISDNPSSWEMPSKSIYNYAKKIKENYPKVWDLGGNIRGNQSFKDLEKVIKRGYWLQSERDFYVKWQSFIARHQHDFRIAGVIANLKWLVYPNIGEDAVKEIIEESIKKKYSDKMNYGGEIEGTMQSFLNNLSKKGTLQKHPIERNSLIYNNEATLNFSNFTTDNPNEIYLQEIIVFDRDKGTGSKIMQDIINSADETGAILTLYAIPLNMGIGEKFLNKAQLIKFYEKFGFIADYKNAFGGEFESAQDLKDYVLSEETEGLDMIRFPKKNNGGVINNNDYSAIDEILHKLKPYQDELTEKWIIGVNEKGEIELTEWDIEMYRFSLTVDLVKAVGNYISDGDVIKEIKLSKDQGSIIISCMVIRDNKEYNFSTEVILAGGYNIQRLHLRYIVKTNLPNKKSNPLYDKLNEKYKGMNKVQKLREQISLSEKNIKFYQNKFETALENSKLTDFEVEKLSRQQKPESWETLDIPWQEIVNRGADKNFNYDENLFNKSQEDYKKSLIKSWRTFNADFIRYADFIKSKRKEIEKLNKKIQDLGYEKMKKGGIITYKEKYNKKYGYDLNETHNLIEISKDTGISKKGLQQIYNKGIGAYKTNPESVRPTVKSKEQWAMGRVYSAVMGGKASKIDANELRMNDGGELLDIEEGEKYELGGQLYLFDDNNENTFSMSVDEIAKELSEKYEQRKIEVANSGPNKYLIQSIKLKHIEEQEKSGIGKEIIKWAKDEKNNVKIIVAFSGGKDSIALVLNLLDSGFSKENIELWHHDVDGDGKNLFDWKCTKSYCKAFADAFGLPILFSFAEGGIEREIFRKNESRQAVFFQKESNGDFHKISPAPIRTKKDGIELSKEEIAKKNTRYKFPAVSADLTTRWCSGIAKIDVMAKAISNSERFENANILILTGERRAESTARSLYLEFEKYKLYTKNRKAFIWRSIVSWTEKQVWDIMEKYKVQPHPCYELGWGRCSCQICIFSSPNHWASVNEINPEKVERVAEIESQIGHTLYNEEEKKQVGVDKSGKPKFVKSGVKLNVIDAKVKRGKSFILSEKLERWGKEANGEFISPIIVEEWKLPIGAFNGDNCGAI